VNLEIWMFVVTIAINLTSAAFIVGSWRQQQKNVIARLEKVEVCKVETIVYDRDLAELKRTDARIEHDVDELGRTVARSGGGRR